MKYLYFLIFTVGVSFSGKAQTGVGSPDASPSAVLDLKSDNKGVLIPRLVLSSSTDVTAIAKGNVDGLLVFNTQTASDVTPGFYYWFNAKWNKILVRDEIGANLPAITNQLALTGDALVSTVNGVSSNVADLSGLSGWVPEGNDAAAASFLGTTNDEPLIFKTANEDRVTIGADGKVSIGSAGSGYALAVRSPSDDEYVARFLPFNGTQGVAIGGAGISKVGTAGNSDFKITPKGSGKVNLNGPVIIKTITAGTAAEDIVVVDADNNLKKIASASVGKTYTAGTGINVAGTVISAAATNTIDLVGKNLTTTVNGVSDTIDLTPALSTATTVANTAAENRISTTVNGVTGTPVTVINSNTLTLTNTELTSTVNGLTSTVADLSGLAGWGMAGTEATAASFLGTTNAQPLIFKTANTDRITIAPNGRIGVGTAPSGFALDLVSAGNDENLASFLSEKDGKGVAFGYDGMRMIGTARDIDFKITPKGAGDVQLFGPAYIKDLPAGAAGEDVVVVDSFDYFKKIASTSVGKTYTAGTGINITGTEISAATVNTLTAANGNLISTVNSVATPAIGIVTTANNGISRASGTITLGGTLTRPTTIAATATSTLSVTGLPVTTNLDTDHVVVADGTGKLKRASTASFVGGTTTVSNTSNLATMNKLSTTVNGVEGAEINIVKNATLTSAAGSGNLAVTINGVTGMSPVANVDTAINGVSATNGVLELGGDLTEPTVITTDAVNTLSIAGLQKNTNAGARVIVVTSDGTLRKAANSSSDFSYQTATIAPGASADVSLDMDATYANVTVSAANTCDRRSMASFSTFRNLLVFTGGQATNKPYSATIATGVAGNAQSLEAASGVPVCGGGGGATQFNFTIQKTGSVIRITNDGDAARRYTINYTAL